MKKSVDTTLLIFIGILLCVLICFGVYFWKYKSHFRNNRKIHLQYKRHERFGIYIPNGFSIHGIDVSRYQQKILWDRVTKMNDMGRKISFVFIKATQGAALVDPYLQENCSNAKKNKIIKGVYHYFEPTIDGKIQALHFLNNISLDSGDLLPVVDIEQHSGVNESELRNRLMDWLITVEEALGVKPIIYTSSKFQERFLSSAFSDYPLWVAHYTFQGKPSVNRHWNFWQHSEHGSVDGIAGKVDFNVFNGDSVAFSKMLVK